MIKAPFNFVSLNHDVFVPEWTKNVSIDVPWTDSESGVIHISFTNLTALHVSNGREAQKDGSTKSYPCNIEIDGQKKYFIPATTIKGMLRSVAEVLCFSKFKESQYNDDYFGYRIFMNPKSEAYKRYHREMENPLCGFLKYENDTYKIYSCGEPERIAISDIKKINYESLGKTLVCSGDMKGKKHEHLFGPELSKDPLVLSKEVVKVFLSVYKPNKEFESKLKALKCGTKLPVFYHCDTNGNVKHFGLSRNYRLPYKHKVSEGVFQKLMDEKGKSVESGLDMVEALFGKIEKNYSLKGRVQVGHAFCKDNVNDSSLIKVKGVLGQPKASYTPLYLRQDKNGSSYKTYNDNIEIAGRKRYRVHSDKYITAIPEGNDNAKTQTELYLIPAGNKFEVSISVHNLRPCEVGLLLSALTFHNNSNVYHNLGMAKSYGYGKIYVDCVKLSGFSNDDMISYLKAFEKELCQFTLATQGVEWIKSEQISTLLSIASNHNSDLELMTLKEYTVSKKDTNYGLLKELRVEGIGFVTKVSLEEERIQARKKQEELEEEKRIKEAEVERERLEEKAKAEKLALEAKREREAQQGLSVLNDRNELGNYKFSKWDGKRIYQMTKRFGWSEIPENQIPFLIDFINRLDVKRDKEKEEIKKFLFANASSFAELIISKTGL